MDTAQVLSSINFGQRVAEDENALERYFVETNQWRRIFRGDVDIIYGAKGAGKSALYYLLLRKSGELRERSIELVAGENLRGETAFSALATDPPTSEQQFIGVWKLYIASIIGRKIHELGVKNDAAQAVFEVLNDIGLLNSRGALAATVRSVVSIVRSLASPKSVEIETKLDPITGSPTFSGKLSRRDTPLSNIPNRMSIDELVLTCERALSDADLSVWVLLDRLDVAFADSKELEENALRALFKVYLDLRNLTRVTLKIFLRDDIWRRITAGGFREASHITRHTTIKWEQGSLLNLIVKRAVQHEELLNKYSVSAADVLSASSRQDEFFYRMFPLQVEKGQRRPTTLDWILTRTCDGTKNSVPREIIHLLNCAVQRQLDVFDMGGYEPEGENLIAGTAFKESLPEVSKVRLEQTLYAEYPSLKERVMKLKTEKTSQSLGTLGAIWGTSGSDTQLIASELVNVGFFEERGQKQDPEFWVPFLYRDALDMIQGSAD